MWRVSLCAEDVASRWDWFGCCMCWGLGVLIRPGALVGGVFGLGAVRLWWVVVVFVGV